MTKFLPPNPLVSILSAVFVAVITAVAAFIFYFDPYSESMETTPLQTGDSALEETTGVPLAQCDDTSDQDLQSCCATWAAEHNIPIVQCVGSWEWKENSCNFVCLSE